MNLEGFGIQLNHHALGAAGALLVYGRMYWQSLKLNQTEEFKEGDG